MRNIQNKPKDNKAGRDEKRRERTRTLHIINRGKTYNIYLGKREVRQRQHRLCVYVCWWTAKDIRGGTRMYKTMRIKSRDKCRMVQRTCKKRRKELPTRPSELIWFLCLTIFFSVIGFPVFDFNLSPDFACCGFDR